MDIVHAFQVNARMRPDQPAVHTVEQTWTYRDLDARSDRVAGLLRAEGITAGDRVAVQLHNRIEFVDLVLGIAKAGAVLVPVSYLDGPAQVRHILDDSGATAYAYDAEVADTAGTVLDDRSDVVAMPVDADDRAPSLAARLSGAKPFEGVDDDERRTFYIGYTSGSTGAPKGVVKDHRSVVQLAYACAIEWHLGRDARQLVTMPMCHSGALWQVIINLVIGGSFALMPHGRFAADTALELIDRWSLTWAVVVPTMSDDLLAINAPTAGASLRSIVSASAPMFSATKHGLLERFPDARLSECYGATETGVVTNLAHEDQLRKIRCVGTPIVGVDLRLLDDDGHPVGPGEIGEIAVRSPYLLSGYLGLPEKTADAARPSGHVVVGDLGRFDDEGYLYVVDRKNDMIITGGLNVYPAEVEEVLRRQPCVADAIVVGLPGERWGETVTAAVVAAGRCDPAELLAACRRELPSYKVPKAVHLLPELPRLVSGKNARRLVRDELIQQSGQEVTDAVR